MQSKQWYSAYEQYWKMFLIIPSVDLRRSHPTVQMLLHASPAAAAATEHATNFLRRVS